MDRYDVRNEEIIKKSERDKVGRQITGNVANVLSLGINIAKNISNDISSQNSKKYMNGFGDAYRGKLADGYFTTNDDGSPLTWDQVQERYDSFITKYQEDNKIPGGMTGELINNSFLNRRDSDMYALSTSLISGSENYKTKNTEEYINNLIKESTTYNINPSAEDGLSLYENRKNDTLGNSSKVTLNNLNPLEQSLYDGTTQVDAMLFDAAIYMKDSGYKDVDINREIERLRPIFAVNQLVAAEVDLYKNNIGNKSEADIVNSLRDSLTGSSEEVTEFMKKYGFNKPLESNEIEGIISLVKEGMETVKSEAAATSIEIWNKEVIPYIREQEQSGVPVDSTMQGTILAKYPDLKIDLLPNDIVQGFYNAVSANDSIATLGIKLTELNNIANSNESDEVKTQKHNEVLQSVPVTLQAYIKSYADGSPISNDGIGDLGYTSIPVDEIKHNEYTFLEVARQSIPKNAKVYVSPEDYVAKKSADEIKEGLKSFTDNEKEEFNTAAYLYAATEVARMKGYENIDDAALSEAIAEKKAIDSSLSDSEAITQIRLDIIEKTTGWNQDKDGYKESVFNKVVGTYREQLKKDHYQEPVTEETIINGFSDEEMDTLRSNARLSAEMEYYYDNPDSEIPEDLRSAMDSLIAEKPELKDADDIKVMEALSQKILEQNDSWIKDKDKYSIAQFNRYKKIYRDPLDANKRLDTIKQKNLDELKKANLYDFTDEEISLFNEYSLLDGQMQLYKKERYTAPELQKAVNEIMESEGLNFTEALGELERKIDLQVQDWAAKKSSYNPSLFKKYSDSYRDQYKPVTAPKDVPAYMTPFEYDELDNTARLYAGIRLHNEDYTRPLTSELQEEVNKVKKLDPSIKTDAEAISKITKRLDDKVRDLEKEKEDDVRKFLSDRKGAYYSEYKETDSIAQAELEKDLSVLTKDERLEFEEDAKVYAEAEFVLDNPGQEMSKELEEYVRNFKIDNPMYNDKPIEEILSAVKRDIVDRNDARASEKPAYKKSTFSEYTRSYSQELKSKKKKAEMDQLALDEIEKQKLRELKQFSDEELALYEKNAKLQGEIDIYEKDDTFIGPELREAIDLYKQEHEGATDKEAVGAISRGIINQNEEWRKNKEGFSSSAFNKIAATWTNQLKPAPKEEPAQPYYLTDDEQIKLSEMIDTKVALDMFNKDPGYQLPQELQDKIDRRLEADPSLTISDVINDINAETSKQLSDWDSKYKKKTTSYFNNQVSFRKASATRELEEAKNADLNRFLANANDEAFYMLMSDAQSEADLVSPTNAAAFNNRLLDKFMESQGPEYLAGLRQLSGEGAMELMKQDFARWKEEFKEQAISDYNKYGNQKLPTGRTFAQQIDYYKDREALENRRLHSKWYIPDEKLDKEGYDQNLNTVNDLWASASECKTNEDWDNFKDKIYSLKEARGLTEEQFNEFNDLFTGNLTSKLTSWNLQASDFMPPIPKDTSFYNDVFSSVMLDNRYDIINATDSASLKTKLAASAQLKYNQLIYKNAEYNIDKKRKEKVDKNTERGDKEGWFGDGDSNILDEMSKSKGATLSMYLDKTSTPAITGAVKTLLATGPLDIAKGLYKSGNEKKGNELTEYDLYGIAINAKFGKETENGKYQYGEGVKGNKDFLTDTFITELDRMNAFDGYATEDAINAVVGIMETFNEATTRVPFANISNISDDGRTFISRTGEEFKPIVDSDGNLTRLIYKTESGQEGDLLKMSDEGIKTQEKKLTNALMTKCMMLNMNPIFNIPLKNKMTDYLYEEIGGDPDWASSIVAYEELTGKKLNLSISMYGKVSMEFI